MRKFGLYGLIIVMVISAFSVAGCDSSDDAVSPLQDPADFSGRIINVDDIAGSDALGTILVQGLDSMQSSDKYVVTITSETILIKKDGKRVDPISFETLAVDQMVRIWFTGQIRESYPAQVNAAQVMISKVEVGLGEKAQLFPGESVFLAEEDLTITFLQVTEDSRCPTDVTCVWAGRVSALVEIDEGSEVRTVSLTHSGAGSGNDTQTFGGYNITFSVLPYPNIVEPIDPNEYKLLLTISKRTTCLTGSLKGHVSIGPLQPVVRPGDDPLDVPPEVYEARKVMIYDRFGEELIHQVDINSDGNYAVDLSPGVYKVDINRLGIDFAKGLPKEIEIVASETIELDIDIDTGIR